MWTYLVHITGLWISPSSDPSVTRNSSLPCRVANWSQFAQDLPGFNSESLTFQETLILGKLATQIPTVDLGIRSPLIFFERCKWRLELHIITFWRLEYVSLNVTQGKDSHVEEVYLGYSPHHHSSNYWVTMCLSMLLCKEAVLRWLVLNHRIRRSTYLKCKFGTYPGPPKFKVW